MAGQSIFGAGTALVTSLPWLKSATVGLWRQLGTWAWNAAVALGFVAFLILVSIMVLYGMYSVGSLGIYAWQMFR
jgi:uncharacterized membrane protein YdfJ with MMPL/SSD domain